MIGDINVIFSLILSKIAVNLFSPTTYCIHGIRIGYYKASSHITYYYDF